MANPLPADDVPPVMSLIGTYLPGCLPEGKRRGGISAAALAARIASRGNPERIRRQLELLEQCGGMIYWSRADGYIRSIR